MAVSAIAVLATTAANVAPITFTEAAWTDNVHANASFTASEHAGVNYARAAASNGTMNRTFVDSNLAGVVSTVNNTASPYYSNSGNTNFNTAGLFGFVYFESNARSCARVNSTLCIGDPAGPPAVPAFAESAFNTMNIRTSQIGGITIAEYTGGDSDPIRTSASCSVGSNGTPGVSPGRGVRLRQGVSLTTVAVPTVSGTSANASGSIIGLGSYTSRITYNAVSSLNYARSEVRLRIEATYIGIDSWTLDILLSRAECGLSQPLGGGVVTAGMAASQMRTADAAQLDATSEDTKAEDLTAPTSDDTPPEASPTSSTSPPSSRNTLTTTEPTSSTSTTTATSKRTATATKTATTAQTTTTTSASPTTAIPTDPGTLSTTALTETVGTVEVDGEELDVVVKGDTVPADARTALTALETWINEGARPSGDWRTFTSSDPDSDGWRWAAVNQQTGTVVYIR